MKHKEYMEKLQAIRREQDAIWEKRCDLIATYSEIRKKSCKHYELQKDLPWAKKGFRFWLDDNNEMRDENNANIHITPHTSIVNYFSEHDVFYADGEWVKEIN